jgi:hypothetical protein
MTLTATQIGYLRRAAPYGRPAIERSGPIKAMLNKLAARGFVDAFTKAGTTSYVRTEEGDRVLSDYDDKLMNIRGGREFLAAIAAGRMDEVRSMKILNTMVASDLVVVHRNLFGMTHYGTWLWEAHQRESQASTPPGP